MSQLTHSQARELVTLALADIDAQSNENFDGFVILDQHTIEKPWGWVFFYDSRKHYESGDHRDLIAGNAPYIVNRFDGSLHDTGTAEKTEYYIQNYEDTGDAHIEAVPALIISGWREGAQKVSATRLLNQQTSLGLARSKHSIDDALDNISTRIQLSDFEHAERLRASLDALGWNVAIVKQAPDSSCSDASA